MTYLDFVVAVRVVVSGGQGHRHVDLRSGRASSSVESEKKRLKNPGSTISEVILSTLPFASLPSRPQPHLDVISPLPKYQGPNLDTLPPRCAFRCPMIYKRSMRHPPPFHITIETQQKQPLTVFHTRPILPPLPLIKPDRRRLSRSMRIPMFNRHQIVILHSAGVGHGKRVRVDGSVQRSPNVDNPVASLE